MKRKLPVLCWVMVILPVVFVSAVVYRQRREASQAQIPQVEIDERVPDLIAIGAEARSSKWHSVRAAYFAEHPHCEFKGCKSKGPFNVHHVRPFHMHPELELDPRNLMTLCIEGENHHLYCGHNGNFQDVNENCREDCRHGVFPEKGLQLKRKHDTATASKTTVAP